MELMMLLTSIIFILLLLTSSHLQAQLLPIVDPQDNTKLAQTYIIHVTEPPHGVVDLLTSQDDQLEEWHRSFLPNTTLDSGEPRLIYSYRHVISGFAARLTHDELKAMEAMDGFVFAHPVHSYRLQTTYTPQFLKLTENKDKAWKQSNYGEGVIIGVIDTGIVPDHPSFQDNTNMPYPPKKWKGCCNFNGHCLASACNRKLIGAKGTSASANATDQIGHGSHVAGIVAGNPVPNANVLSHAAGTAVGIAPLAHLAIYKVCEGTSDDYKCNDSSILYGIDSAIEDGVDVLSISLNGLQLGVAEGEDFYTNSVMKGTFSALMEKDIISCISAGNDGSTNNSIQNDGPWVLTVGASAIDRVVRTTVKLENGMEFDGECAYQPNNVLPEDPEVPLQYPGQNAIDPFVPRLSGSLDNMSVEDSIVMCGRSIQIDGNVNMSEVVAAANGSGIIVLNSKDDMYTTISDPYVVPGSNINYLDSLELIDYLNNTPNATATIIYKGTLFNARRAPAVASFSSRGPSLSNGGILKPDVIAPGVNILSAWNNEAGSGSNNQSNSSFKFASGSSMATAHVAGIAALVKSAHPDWTASEIKSAIMTTAYTVDGDNEPISDEKSPTHAPADYYAMGAGHVDPSKAVDPGLVFDTTPQDYLGYLCGLGYTDAEIQVMAKKSVNCSQVKKIRPSQLNSPTIYANMSSSPKLLNSHKIKIKRTVKNVGEPESYYSVKIKEPKGVKVKVGPKKLKFKHLNQTKSFTVKLVKKSGSPSTGFLKGQISWVSQKHKVTSPILVTF